MNVGMALDEVAMPDHHIGTHHAMFSHELHRGFAEHTQTGLELHHRFRTMDGNAYPKGVRFLAYFFQDIRRTGHGLGWRQDAVNATVIGPVVFLDEGDRFI